MQMDDLRDYLDILEEYREVQRIDAEVDWNLEMGAITRRVYDLGAPAALFVDPVDSNRAVAGAAERTS